MIFERIRERCLLDFDKHIEDEMKTAMATSMNVVPSRLGMLPMTAHPITTA